MRGRICRAITLICALLLAAAASAERLPVTTYSTVNGLPHDRIKRIIRDARGFLWFGTATGLSRFDGERFFTYTVAHGLSHASINDVIEASDGTYWVGTNGGGVCRFRPAASDAFTCVRVGAGLANRVNALLEDHRAQIWAGTDNGLFRLDPAAASKGFVPIPSAGQNVWALGKTADGHVWVGHANGLARHAPSGFVWNYRLWQEGPPISVWTLLFDRDGRLWLGHDGGLLVVRPAPVTETDAHPPLWRSLQHPLPSPPADGSLPTAPGDARAWTVADGLISPQPGTIWQASDGNVWVGSGVWARAGSGVNVFDGRTLRTYAVEHGLGDDTIISMGEDANGNLWLGTYATGAVRIARGGLIAYSERDGLAPGQVFAIVPSGGRDFYTLTAGLRAHRFDGTRFFETRPNIGSAEWRGWERAPLIARDGEWWIPTREGLYRFGRVGRLDDLAQAKPMAVYGVRDGLPSNDVLAPFEDSRGDVWFGAQDRESVTRWARADGTFHVYAAAEGVTAVGSAVTFREDRGRNLWIGFSQGAIARLRAGRFDVFRAADGVPAGQINTLHLDATGRLWIGSRDAAAASGGPAEGVATAAPDAELARIDEPHSERPRIFLYPPDLLSGLGVRCIAEDGAGALYIGGDQGIQRFDPRSGRVRRLTRADGLPSEDVEIAFRDHDGSLWFGTWKGMARLDGNVDFSAAQPSVFIGDLRIDGVTYPIAELGETAISGLELRPGQNQLDIEFFAVTFATGQPLLYQYRLDGADDDWGPAGDRHRVTYVSMSPGQYRFLVRAVSANGVVTSPASISFVILPPIWQRAWFIATAMAAAVLIVVAAHRARVKRLLAVERIRTAIATDLHDDIGASLSQIAILSEVVRQRRPEDAAVADPLARIATTSRELVDAMSDIVWAINPQRDSLLDLIQRMRRFASDVLAARGITFAFHAPDAAHLKLGADVRRHVFLIFKEAVSNLARHSGANEATIELSLDNGRLSLTIEDDGRGFDRAAHSSGHGLPSMRSRAQAIGGTLTISGRPAGGTCLRLDLPLGRRARRLPRRVATK